MKKVGFLAVSLAALMSVGAARADIASTTYVTDAVAPKEATANKVKSTEALDTLKTSEDRYPSMAAANKLAQVQAQAAVAGAINTYATKTELTNETNARTSADTALGTRIDDEVTARTSADNAINTKIGIVPADKTVVGMIADAQKAATYDDTALAGRVDTIEKSAVMTSGATKAKIDAIGTNTTNIATNASDIAEIKTEQGTQNTKISALESGKQDNLGYTAENAANKTITISAAATASDTKYPSEKAVATELAKKADASTLSGYATTSALNAVKTTADNALPTATYNTNTTVAADGTYVKKTNTVAANLTALDTAAKAAKDQADKGVADAAAAKTAADAKLPTTTYNTQIGTVSATNMGTTATTVVGGIKEAVTEAAAAQTTADKGVSDAAKAQTKADSAFDLANAAIPKPSGSCTDCVLKFNGTAFSWEEIGR